MLSLLGSLLGFATGLAPAIMKFVERKQDNAHELKMIAAQTAAQAESDNSKLQATIADGQLKSIIQSMKESTKITMQADQWVINTVAMVRPIITYSFFFTFAYLEISLVMGWLSEQEFGIAWDEETRAIFATIMSHWFGHRTSKHLMGKA